MSLILYVAAFVIFAIAAWWQKSLVALGLACLTAANHLLGWHV